MRTLVIYESMFGNTHSIADAIAEGMPDGVETRVLQASAVGPEDLDIDLVVIGATTHAWSMPRSSTRDGALKDSTQHPDHQLEPDALNTGIRELLASLPNQGGRHAAVFDTRLDKPRAITGSAARRIARKMRSLEFDLLDVPHSFVVDGMDGPLGRDELTRALAWGEALGSRIRMSSDAPQSSTD